MNARASWSIGEKSQEFFTVKDLADYLQVSPATIYRYTEKRLIGFVNLPRGLRFRKTDVEDFIDHKHVARLDE